MLFDTVKRAICQSLRTIIERLKRLKILLNAPYIGSFSLEQKKKNLIDLYYKTKIDGGLYIGHPYCISINVDVVIGSNCNIHKGVTIGQENRGERKGTPKLGNCVWIGVNSTIVGNITIGDDVLIAPNTFVNRDIPSHSVVFGNPCIVKHKENATEGYLNRRD